MARVSEQIRLEEYRFSALAPESWTAPNRVQGLRARVGPCGLEIVPRSPASSDAGAAWALRLETVSFGRSGAVRPVETLGVAVDGERVELDHGALVEWFVNDEHGIEQGWTILERPSGAGPLELGLVFGGDLSLRFGAHGRSAGLVDDSGEQRLRYGDLVAWDATGRELEARLLPSGAGGLVQVQDAGAVYPITVDPQLTSGHWVAASNQALAEFGFSVSSAGDVNGDGYSDVIIGAPRYDGGQLDEGRAFVFHGSATGLAVTPAWIGEPNLPVVPGGLKFGTSVATVGDVNQDGYDDVIIGAPEYLLQRGRVFVYHGSETGLSPTVDWTAEADQVSSRFGSSVAAAGDVNGDGYADAIIGAESYSNPPYDGGRAFVYHGSAAGLGVAEAWSADIGQSVASFGGAVSTAGDVNGDGYSDVIIGAIYFDNGGGPKGGAFVYHGSAAGLGATQAWQAGFNGFGGGFGSSVSTAGDVNGDGYSDVIVGADRASVGQNLEGRAFVYHGSAAGLGVVEAWTAESNVANAAFGASVSAVGDVNGDGYSEVLVGAPMYTSGEQDEGRAYLFNGSGTGLRPNPVWSVQSNQAGANFGRSVASAGDVDGDGYSDVIIGADGYSSPEFREGAAFVYRFSATTLGVSYCTSGTSANGCEAWLSGSGLASATAPSGFSLVARNVKGAKDGVFFFSTGGRQAVSWGNGTSFLCVTPPVRRAGLLPGRGTPGKCNGVLTQDLNALWCPTCPKPALNPGAGALVQVQLWYRDPINTSNQTSSMSDALEFLVAP